MCIAFVTFSLRFVFVRSRFERTCSEQTGNINVEVLNFFYFMIYKFCSG